MNFICMDTNPPFLKIPSFESHWSHGLQILRWINNEDFYFRWRILLNLIEKSAWSSLFRNLIWSDINIRSQNTSSIIGTRHLNLLSLFNSEDKQWHLVVQIIFARIKTTTHYTSDFRVSQEVNLTVSGWGDLRQIEMGNWTFLMTLLLRILIKILFYYGNFGFFFGKSGFYTSDCKMYN